MHQCEFIIFLSTYLSCLQLGLYSCLRIALKLKCLVDFGNMTICESKSLLWQKWNAINRELLWLRNCVYGANWVRADFYTMFFMRCSGRPASSWWLQIFCQQVNARPSAVSMLTLHWLKKHHITQYTYNALQPLSKQSSREVHYAKLSQAMRAPWVDRFLNNEMYCYPLSKKRRGHPAAIPSDCLPGGTLNLRPATT